VKFKDVLAVWDATGLKKTLDKFDNNGKIWKKLRGRMK